VAKYEGGNSTRNILTGNKVTERGNLGTSACSIKCGLENQQKEKEMGFQGPIDS